MTGIRTEVLILGESCGRQVEQPGRDYAAAPPNLGNVSKVELEAVFSRQGRAGSVAQDIEALRVSLHQTVLDAVVDHLDEMSGTVRSGVEITQLRPGIPSHAT